MVARRYFSLVTCNDRTASTIPMILWLCSDADLERDSLRIVLRIRARASNTITHDDLFDIS